MVVLDPRNRAGPGPGEPAPRLDPARRRRHRPGVPPQPGGDRRLRARVRRSSRWSGRPPRSWASPSPDEVIDCSEAQGWWKPARGPVLRDAHAARGADLGPRCSSRARTSASGRSSSEMGAEELDRVLRAHGLGRLDRLGAARRAGRDPTGRSSVLVGHGLDADPDRAGRRGDPAADDRRVHPARQRRSSGVAAGFLPAGRGRRGRFRRFADGGRLQRFDRPIELGDVLVGDIPLRKPIEHAGDLGGRECRSVDDLHRFLRHRRRHAFAESDTERRRSHRCAARPVSRATRAGAAAAGATRWRVARSLDRRRRAGRRIVVARAGRNGHRRSDEHRRPSLDVHRPHAHLFVSFPRRLHFKSCRFDLCDRLIGRRATPPGSR